MPESDVSPTTNEAAEDMLRQIERRGLMVDYWRTWLDAALATERRNGWREGFNECAKRTLEAIRRDRAIPEGDPLLTILVPDALLDEMEAPRE